MSDRFTR